MRGARVFCFIHAVAEAGDLLLGSQHAFHVFHGISAGLVDGVKQAHHALIGAAMERALERADGTCHGGMDVC